MSVIFWDDDEYIGAITIVMESDSDGDDEDAVAATDVVVRQPHVWGSGSRRGKAPNLERHRLFYSQLLFTQFSVSSPVITSLSVDRFYVAL